MAEHQFYQLVKRESPFFMKNSGYEDLAHPVRRDFSDPRQTLEELYGRMIFNVICGNTDDHARNPYRLLGRPNLPAQPCL
ncbi:HipA domain-containing protein [uncultured Thiocystis sp.]|uniref:HipA domain-containing protein n=1 Tax=uncultured Thiocystis sp. TaxID=1202134 RepID=UPI0025FF641D|nr:HipA domain-containing protein [uncultured Thiocystis sp.]